jgi:hypothetical protein
MHCRAVDDFMALAGVEGTVRCPATVCLQTVRGGSDAGDFLILWDLVEKLGQHRGISDGFCRKFVAELSVGLRWT